MIRMDFVNKLFLPIYRFLEERKYAFETFDRIGEDNQRLFGSTHRQFKTEKWFQAELAVFLKKIGWIVGTEVNIDASPQKADLCLMPRRNRDSERVYVELKNYVNTEQSPRGIDFQQLNDDFDKLRSIPGLSLALLPKNTLHDKRKKYSEKIYEKILKDCPDIREVFSKAIHYNIVQDEGFWVTWWTFTLPVESDTKELKDYISGLKL